MVAYDSCLVKFVSLVQLLSISSFQLISAVNWTPQQWNHPLKTLTENELILISNGSLSDLGPNFDEILSNLLIVRVPGTSGHRKVHQYITDTMRSLDWRVEEDRFTDNTPFGTQMFTNIIATLNPNACKRLVLACHYDSKYSEGNKFLGATDSAVPCSMMIEIARSLSKQLVEHREKYPTGVSLQFIFFDGEEAFVEWSDEDSLYGSRHLAEKWNEMKFPQTQKEAEICQGDFVSELDRMDVMILFDLLGAASPSFYNSFAQTSALFERLIKTERKLNELQLLESHPPNSHTSYFRVNPTYSMIDDDHVPFMKRGVPIVHIIPTPFPSVWHRNSDNLSAVDFRTVRNLLKIFKVFVAEYLHLSVK